VAFEVAAGACKILVPSFHAQVIRPVEALNHLALTVRFFVHEGLLESKNIQLSNWPTQQAIPLRHLVAKDVLAALELVRKAVHIELAMPCQLLVSSYKTS